MHIDAREVVECNLFDCPLQSHRGATDHDELHRQSKKLIAGGASVEPLQATLALKWTRPIAKLPLEPEAQLPGATAPVASLPKVDRIRD